MNETNKKERSKEERYYSKRRGEVRKILEEFGCIKSPFFSDLENYRFLAAIGCSHFYVINKENGGWEYNQRKKVVSFTYRTVILNIYVAGVDNSTGINRLEDMTTITKMHHNPDEKVGRFGLDREVYCIPINAAEFFKRLDLLLKTKVKEQQEKIEEERKYIPVSHNFASFLKSV